MRGNKLYNAIAEALADSGASTDTITAVAGVFKSQNIAFKKDYFYDYILKRRSLSNHDNPPHRDILPRS